MTSHYGHGPTTSPPVSPQDTNSVLTFDELDISSEVSSILLQPDLHSTLSDFNWQELSKQTELSMTISMLENNS